MAAAVHAKKPVGNGKFLGGTDLSRGGHDVVAAFEEPGNEAGANALRGASDDDGGLGSHGVLQYRWGSREKVCARGHYFIGWDNVESLSQSWEILGMHDLNDIAVFVRVAQLGSFSRAAHALGTL